ncbi:glycosyltransferase family 39 protein [Qipengyuania sp. GH1]|uniref:ArnT family glycosyltransferase n=1 Tax=Qipengyuania aestuarii TaxID=2867241 RepID=UPI001C875C3F|nr:glycosyltransferase family 39 protein [Qipengyuania aestuarii]MBX7536184.1 glycosyltransferase family 39 protein [Qipengyuania aestuarii]
MLGYQSASRMELQSTGHRIVRSDQSRAMTTGIALLCGLLLLQLYLVWFKSFNWDEFLHYGHVFAARNGTLDAPFQVLHARILFWVPDAAASIVNQMRIARLFMFACTLVTLAAIYGLVQRFTNRENALLAAIAYLGAGYVFTQSFSIRADPMAAASLMSALYLMTSKVKPLASYFAAGALVGLASMITMKSIFYAPCFAGLAWLVWCENEDKRNILTCFAAAALAAGLSFGTIYLWHTSNLAPLPEQFSDTARFIAGGRRWILPEKFTALGYVMVQTARGLVFFVGMLCAVYAWRNQELSSAQKIALAGLAAPLLTLLFYRNTFPYFFVYLLAPVAVAISASWGLLVRRYGFYVVLVSFAAAPVILAVTTPRDVLVRQAALIEYVHSEYPQKTGYLARSSILPDYPRVISHLATGPGMAGYNLRKRPLIAEAFARGELPFILATGHLVLFGLQGVQDGEGFLPEDVAIMRDHYVQQWGPLYREGEQIEPTVGKQDVTIPRPGSYILEGNSVIVNGSLIEHGETAVLDAGSYSIECIQDCDRNTVLWRGDRLPGPPPVVPLGTFYTSF